MIELIELKWIKNDLIRYRIDYYWINWIRNDLIKYVIKYYWITLIEMNKKWSD